MLQAVLYVALYGLGVAVCLAIGPRRRPGLCCALGLPVGLAVVVPPAALLAGVGVPYGRPLVATVAVAIAAAAAWAIRRRGAPDRRTLRILGVGTAVFATCAVALSAVSFSVFTYDSHDIIVNARVLVDDAGFGRGLMYEMDDRAPFMLVAHSLAPLIRVNYLWGLAPLLALSFIAVFAGISWHAFARLGVAARRRAAPVALVAAALSTVYLWQFHFLYIHENMPSAIYLFIFAGLFWLAENGDDGDREALPIACIALLAFTLMRVENPLATVLFGALALLPSRLPARPLLPWLTAVVVATVGWHVALMVQLPTESKVTLSPSRAGVLIALLALLYGGWLASRLPALARLRRQAPVAIAALTLLALAYAFATRTDDMVASARALRSNLTAFDDWGVTWIAIAALAVVGRFAVAPPAAQVFSWGVALYFGMVLLLAYGRDPYVTTMFDSGMRMALHVLPLLFFYVGLQLALLHVTASPAPAADGTSAPA